ncbi:MAG TPA: arsenate reductase family protein [Lacunisphaera sp.]
MSKIIVYTYRNCDTCRKAVKWLGRRGIEFVERPIRETPPDVTELRTMLAALNGERRRLFNTSGKDYRELKLGDKSPTMSDAEAFQLLSQNGNLVKRPFLLGPKIGLVGFDEQEWSAALDR